MSYAKDTVVSPEKSVREIEAMLRKYGATRFASGWDDDAATVYFEAKGRHIRFIVPKPKKDDRRFTSDARGRARTSAAARAAWEQEERRRWRALALVIKGKLEAVESGITSFENEFLAQIVLPDGVTVGDWIGPRLTEVYALGRMPMLPAGHP